MKIKFLTLLKVIIVCLQFFFFIEQTQATEKIKIMLKWDHQFQFAGYYAAVEYGIFNKYGIDAELVSRINEDGSVTELYKSLRDKKVDFLVGGSDVLLEIDEGQPFVIVATYFQKSPFAYFYRPDLEINGAQDIFGKKIMNSNGDFSIFELKTIAHKHNLVPDWSESKWSFTFDEILAGEADIKATYALSGLWKMKETGQKLNYFTASDYGVDFFGDILITRKETIEKNDELVERVRLAVKEGWELALQNPNAIAQMIVKKYPARVEKYKDDYEFNIFSSKIIKDVMIYPLVEVGLNNKFRWNMIKEHLKNIQAIKGQFDIKAHLFDYEAIQHKKNDEMKERFWMLIIFLGGSIFFVVLYLFIFNKKLLNERVEQLRKSEKFTILGTLSAGISHEINNPLAIIKGNVSLLKKDLLSSQFDADEISKRFEKVELSIFRMQKIVESLRLYARQERTELSKISVNKIVLQTYDLIKHMFHAENVQLRLEIIDKEIFIKGDETKLMQILINLLSNAKDAVEVNSNKEVKLILHEDEERVYLSVEDNGMGISDSIKEKIGLPFFTTKPVGKGTGLGLGIVNEYVEEFSGKFKFDSLLGKGSTFTVSFQKI